MSAASVKISPALKQLIALPRAKGSSIPSPGDRALTDLFGRIAGRAEKGGVSRETWLTLCTAGVMTVNSPDSLCGLYDFAGNGEVQRQAANAAIMRETGLKCISFNGIPRTINNLGALRNHLSTEVIEKLDTSPHREVSPENIQSVLKRGKALWDGIYEPHSAKLLHRLAESHPDLPVHILSSHYSALLSDPFTTSPKGGHKVGRVLTSIVAMTCLRAQQGVGPQVTSHVFGLKKANLAGGGGEGEQKIKGQDWLCSDEGVKWVLESTDEISEVIAGGETSFAGTPGRDSKL